MIQGKLLISVNDIYKAEEEVKDLINYNDINSFLNNSLYCDKICKDIPVVYEILQNQLLKNKTIQSCIIYESVLIASLAKYYNCNLISTNEGRFAYSNNDNIKIIQYGDPNHFDCELIIDNENKTLEIKKPLARAGEKDLIIDEKGYPKYNDNFSSDINKIIMSFNILDYIGTNIKFNEEDAQSIAKDYFNNINMILTTTTNGINWVILSYEDAKPYISYDGSEIRTTGKNWIKTKTLNNYLLNYIENNGKKEGEIVELPVSVLAERTKCRGKNSLSEWRKINKIFRIKDKDILFEDDKIVRMYYKDIEQNKPTACAHVTLDIPEVDDNE